jgi:hypothetical protein
MEPRQVLCVTDNLKVSSDRPFFLHPRTDEPVYVVFDPPHLLKCLRNNLMSYDIEVS